MLLRERLGGHYPRANVRHVRPGRRERRSRHQAAVVHPREGLPCGGGSGGNQRKDVNRRVEQPEQSDRNCHRPHGHLENPEKGDSLRGDGRRVLFRVHGPVGVHERRHRRVPEPFRRADLLQDMGHPVLAAWLRAQCRVEHPGHVLRPRPVRHQPAGRHCSASRARKPAVHMGLRGRGEQARQAEVRGVPHEARHRLLALERELYLLPLRQPRGARAWHPGARDLGQTEEGRRGDHATADHHWHRRADGQAHGGPRGALAAVEGLTATQAWLPVELTKSLGAVVLAGQAASR
mmetsp:Transcript_78983/g.228325  ORF Transcript_78983/g.228325 Transcript_78983/m.228325 type:complete len:292 (+) Transcript_78983:347-1222(+)